MLAPKVSVITVVYNGEKFIESTIQNVLRNKNENIEFLIIDGESKDSTLDIIDKYRQDIDVFISEPDNGIFDAMNKGIKASSGEWLLFINAGDLLIDKIFKKIDFNDVKDAAIIYGNTIRSGRIRTYPFPIEMIKYGALPACHQSTFYNKHLLKSNLKYDTRYSLFGENELLMRLYKGGFKIIYKDVDVSFFLGGGISDIISSEVRKARYLFLYKYYGLTGIFRGIMLKIGLKKFEPINENEILL